MLVKVIVILPLLLLINCQDYEEETEEERLDRINTQWAFVLYDLIDYYDEYSKVQKDFLIGTASYKEKISAELKYSKYLRNQSKEMRLKEENDEIPSEYQIMHEILLKPNYAILEDKDLIKLIEFSNRMEEKSKNNVIEDPNDSTLILTKRDYEDRLFSSRNETYLEEIWKVWQKNISADNDNFTEILFLSEKAAVLNGDDDFMRYWENTVQFSDGYTDFKTVWEEIEPFYKKFHKFVLDRLNNYYETNFTHIPVYLTGSKFGEDWSNLIDVVLPHQQIYQDAVTSLKSKSKRSIYQHCNKVADSLKFKQNPELFWKESKFDTNNCPGEVISFSSSEYSIFLTCNKTTWIDYLNTQEKALQIGLKNLDYTSLPYRDIKSSFVESAIESLGSTIAIHNLPYDEFIEKDAFTTHLNATENLHAAKLMVALRVLPKLAYYYAVDTWRINEIQSPSEDIIKSWWDERMKIQGVQGITNKETDFFEDEFIVKNKPYLGKFLGNILQFNILSQLELTSEDNPNIISQLLDHDFDSFIKEIPEKNPKDLVSWHYSIEQITHYEIQEYFSSLEEYFESAPLEPLPFLERELYKGKIIETTTVIPTPETTPKENAYLSRKNPDVSTEVKAPEDLPKEEEKTSMGHAMYVLITIGACAIIVVGLLVFKRLVKMKRPRSNNRRFEA